MPKLSQNFPMISISMDRSMNPVLVQGPSHVTGVDAREQGSALKFPGFVATTMSAASTSAVVPKSFHSFSMQKGTSNGFLRGFIYHDTGVGEIVANFYDSLSAIWRRFVIAADASLTAADGGKTDVTSASVAVFVTYLDDASTAVQQQKTFFFDGSNFISTAMGAGLDEGWTSIGTPAASASGQLSAGEYQVGIRLIDTRRNVKTGLSQVAVVTGITAGQDIESTASITLPTGWDATTGSTGKTKVIYIRTIADKTTGFVERQGDYDGASMTLRWGGSTANGGLTDFGLLRKNDPHDNKLERVGLPPKTTRIGHHQGVTVMQLEGDVVDEGNTDIVFSPSHDFRPEDFPRSNVYRLGTDIGDIVQFVRGGDFLAAMTESAMIRFHKQGFALAANAFELGWGPRSRYGSVAVGATIFSVSETGLYLVNSGNGSFESVGAVGRIITNDWVADIKADTPATAIPNIHLAYDESLGVVFIVNNVKQQALMIWVSPGRITLLEDFPWTLSATLPDPPTGGPKRAWFFAPADTTGGTFRHDQIWSADVDRTGSFTMSGLTSGSNTLNGTISTAAVTDSLTDTGKTWVAEVLGATVYIFTGTDEVPQKAIVDGPVNTAALASDDFIRANNNSVGSDWTEVEGAASEISISSNQLKFDDSSAGDDNTYAIWEGSPATFSASDEPYRVEAVFNQVGDSDTSADRPVAIFVIARATGPYAQTNPTTTGYYGGIAYRNLQVGNATYNVGVGAADALYFIYRVDDPINISVVASAAETARPSSNQQVSVALELNGSTIKLFIDGTEKLSATDSTYTSGDVGVGVAKDSVDADTHTNLVDRFVVFSSDPTGTITDTLELDRTISGMATGDKYTISPVKYEVRLPSVGNPSERLWNRHTVEQIGAYLTNHTAPSATDNNRLRFVTFRAGSDTVQTSQWVAITTDPDNMVGDLSSAHGLGIQAGLQNYEAGSTFELVAMNTKYYAQIGNTRITANT